MEGQVPCPGWTDTAEPVMAAPRPLVCSPGSLRHREGAGHGHLTAPAKCRPPLAASRAPTQVWPPVPEAHLAPPPTAGSNVPQQWVSALSTLLRLALCPPRVPEGVAVCPRAALPGLSNSPGRDRGGPPGGLRGAVSSRAAFPVLYSCPCGLAGVPEGRGHSPASAGELLWQRELRGATAMHREGGPCPAQPPPGAARPG